MMKIVASLVILGLCANVAFVGATGSTPTPSSQMGAFSSSVLNSTAVQVVKGSNSTDSANWDSSSSTTAVAGVSSVWFGAGATNDTSYLWAFTTSSQTSAAVTAAGSCGTATACGNVYTTSSFRKRTINNTIAGLGNDTTEASVVGDTTVATSIPGYNMKYATGPGYFAVLSKGLDTVATPNYQVWFTIINGASGSASTTKLTSTADVFAPSLGVACTTTTFTLGNVFYDRGTAAFFYTFSKMVSTTPVATSSDVTAGTCDSGTATVVNTIYLGATYANGTVFLTTPISVAAVTSANAVSNLIAGNDNTNAASYIWLAYKDATTGVATTYVSKTAISANTTAIGPFSALVKDSVPSTPTGTGASTYVTMAYAPATIWSSNNSYAVTVANTTTSTPYTGTTAGTPVVTTNGYVNYFNGTTTGVDTGLTTASTSGTPAGYWAWQLNTGYTVFSGVTAASGSPAPTTYTYATYWANGTANTTAVTAGTLSYGAPQFYEDVNGTQWIGWYDVDTANTNLVYNAYLAKFQGQLNIPAGASILSALSAFIALFLAAIFVF